MLLLMALRIAMLILLLAGSSVAAELAVNSSGMNSIVKNTTAIITWNTTNFSDSLVKYGIDPGNYTFIKHINESVIFHNVTLNNLSPDTNYYFVINSTNIIDSTQSREAVFWTPYDNLQGNPNITNIEIQQLTDYEEFAGSPVWIEDKIFYASNRTGNLDVWVMDKDGSNKTRITNSTADEYPSDTWVSSENNSKIYKVLYVARINGSSNIWATNGNGTNKTQLTNDGYENFDPIIVYVPHPVVFGMQPSGRINNNVPLINASYYSYYGNINKENISVDGLDVTPYANISISGLNYIPIEPLQMGWHTFIVTLETDRDTKGLNHQSFEIRYIYNISPTCQVLTNTPTISANISVDYGNISSVVMTIDGINVTSNAKIYPSYIEYIPIIPLSNGSHSVSLEVATTMGFIDRENWNFFLNSGGVCNGGGFGGSGSGGLPKIMFISNRSGNSDLWIMNLDGTGLQQMTYDSSNETSPSWVESKDIWEKSKVVYVSDKSGYKDIWSMDVNGSNKTQLTNKVFDEDKPTASYVGGIIYTESKEGVSNLYAMNTNGTGNIKITNSSSFKAIPAYSSLDSQLNEGILYGSEGKGQSGIYLMNFKEKGHKVKFWKLEEGYSLKVEYVDTESAPNLAWLKLQRDGITKDEKVVALGQTFSLFDNGRAILNAVLNRINESNSDYFEAELMNVTQYSFINGSPLFTNTTKILINKILLNELIINTTPPASVKNLANVTYLQNHINWTWNDPQDSDFAKVMVYLDGVYKKDVLKGIQQYNATVDQGTHTIGIRTVDINGNVNATMVTHTATTILPAIRYINGTVIDSVNNTGIPNVGVSTNTTLSSTTNEFGFYSFEVTEGTYNLTAKFDPTYYMNNTIMVSTIGQAVAEQDIELLKKQTANITGSVTG